VIWRCVKRLLLMENNLKTNNSNTSHERPAAMLVLPEKPKKPWRVAIPDDLKDYGDLQSPVMDDRP